MRRSNHAPRHRQSGVVCVTHIPPGIPNHRRPGLRNVLHTSRHFGRLRTPQEGKENKKSYWDWQLLECAGKTARPRHAAPGVRVAGGRGVIQQAHVRLSASFPFKGLKRWEVDVWRQPEACQAGGVCATTGQHCPSADTARLRARVRDSLRAPHLPARYACSVIDTNRGPGALSLHGALIAPLHI